MKYDKQSSLEFVIKLTIERRPYRHGTETVKDRSTSRTISGNVKTPTQFEKLVDELRAEIHAVREYYAPPLQEKSPGLQAGT